MLVLVNGSPKKEFNMQKGLRQGDALSPLLFNLVVEVLHLLLLKEENLSIILGIKLGNGPTLSHLQFADDTILFLENNSHTRRGINIVLSIFELLSGLKINFSKSQLYAAKNSDCIEEWVSELQCDRGKWPIQYLGTSIGSSPYKTKFWLPLLKKIRTKFTKWKCKNLNKASRSTLIKATINILPVHWFSLFRAPKKVISSIEKTKRSFFWQELNEEGVVSRKLHSIS